MFIRVSESQEELKRSIKSLWIVSLVIYYIRSIKQDFDYHIHIYQVDLLYSIT